MTVLEGGEEEKSRQEAPVFVCVRDSVFLQKSGH